MDTLEVIEEKLQQARSLLDDVASRLTSSEIKCRSADIEHVGEALAAISDIQISIYEQRPDLKPKYLNDLGINRDENHNFGRILIQNEQNLSKNKPNEAIQLLNEFKASNPPKEYVEMANSEINRIKKLFSV
ncbi:MAG: hypothetical protein P8103_07905 [Candidatus Thiodiazotropha sp.]